MHAPANTQPAPSVRMQALPKSGPLASKLLPIVATVGAGFLVGSYVKSQLSRESNSIDRIFSQQNTPEVMAARKRDLLTDTYGDPRNSLLNILGWVDE
ncbi:hypothetical protein F5Y16DRAFT_392578 [Xylariaceae sp. FL0255]|nr:hypothetical protein F5Y16DRAFT_392578 [Xylariaceae sp. FL0255]